MPQRAPLSSAPWPVSPGRSRLGRRRPRPGGHSSDLAEGEDGSTTTLAEQATDQETQLLDRAQGLLTRADGPDSARAASQQDLADAKAELLALTDALVAERSQGADRASRSNERTALSTEEAIETSADAAAAAPVTSGDVARASDRVAMLLQDFGETAASVVTPRPRRPRSSLPSGASARRRCSPSAVRPTSPTAGSLLRAHHALVRPQPHAALRRGRDAGRVVRCVSAAVRRADRPDRLLPFVLGAGLHPGREAGPGCRSRTSNHGWGLAIDLTSPASNPGSAQYRWLRNNAPLYGWDNPAWARSNGSKPEPWHFEYAAGW
ncbi:D-alanyl-D-alanine carboxypeptidase family protein [Oerskovia sp. M15]